jgi:hypothetical protein
MCQKFFEKIFKGQRYILQKYSEISGAKHPE